MPGGVVRQALKRGYCLAKRIAKKKGVGVGSVTGTEKGEDPSGSKEPLK